MDLGISGRRAIVTGASRGIGRAIARSLAEEGARVVLMARSLEALEIVRRSLPRPDEHACQAVDLMEEGAAAKAAEASERSGPVDIVVHNLGGSAGVFPAMSSADDWAKVWRFNVGVAHELNRVILPKMAQRKWGRVVFLSTLSARTHNGYAAYVSAKCALEGYVKSVSREFAKDNVVLAAVAPGAIYSEGRHFARLQKEDPAALERYFQEHLPTRRLGRAEDVGPVVAFLCSEQVSFMAGAVVGVDGGGM